MGHSVPRGRRTSSRVWQPRLPILLSEHDGAATAPHRLQDL